MTPLISLHSDDLKNLSMIGGLLMVLTEKGA